MEKWGKGTMFCLYSNTSCITHMYVQIAPDTFWYRTCYNHFIPTVSVGKERRILIGSW